MILGQITADKINPSYLNIMLSRFSKQYVNGFFKSKKLSAEVNRLTILGDYIRTEYNIDMSIQSIVLYILNHISIDKDYNVSLDECSLQNVDCKILYKLICFGNLTCKGSTIFQKAFNYATIRTRLEIKIRWLSDIMMKR